MCLDASMCIVDIVIDVLEELASDVLQSWEPRLSPRSVMFQRLCPAPGVVLLAPHVLADIIRGARGRSRR